MGAPTYSSSTPAELAGESPRLIATRTFLLTDIEGSTALWERVGPAYRHALERHNHIVREEVQRHGGEELSEAGDGFLIAFRRTNDAIRCAVDIQKGLAASPWPSDVGTLAVRMGVHLGDVEVFEKGRYSGIILHRASRIRSLAHGGQILCSNAAAAAVRDEGFEMLELGVFGLRGVPIPERLFQVCWPEMPRRQFPLPAANPARTNNLPIPLSALFGRTADVARVRGALFDSSSESDARKPRLLTLTGPGGIGKTRLALALGEELLKTTSYAVWFVGLADVVDARLLASTVRDALRIDPGATGEPLDQLVEWLAAQPSILVLDNLEQLGVDGAKFVQALLERAPSLVCIVTSRHRLRIPGERQFPVPPLAVSSATSTPTESMRCASVQLFVARAQAVCPDFALSEQNVATVRELCSRLEGLPLAIELAAARADVVAPRQMIEALSDRLRFLAADNPHMPERHRTLRAAIDWSYGLLRPPLQQFFVNLSVFRGGWTAAAAQCVAAPPVLRAEVLNALSELRGCSLVSGEDSGDGMRFRMLETLRSYAEERLPSDSPAELVRAKHREFFLQMAEEAEAAQRHADQALWLDRLESEKDNLRTAIESARIPDERVRLASALTHFWMVRGYVTEARNVVSQCFREAAGLPAALRASLNNAAGILAWTAGDLHTARKHFENTLEYFRSIDDLRNVSGMLNNLGIVSAREGDHAAARSFFEESLQLYNELGFESQRAQVLANIGALSSDCDDFEAARRFLEESLRIHRNLSDAFGEHSALHNLAHVALRAGSLSECERLVGISLPICERLLHRVGVASNWDLLAAIAAQRGDFATVATWLGAIDFLRREHEVTSQVRDEAQLIEAAAEARRRLGEARFAEAFREGEVNAARHHRFAPR